MLAEGGFDSLLWLNLGRVIQTSLEKVGKDGMQAQVDFPLFGLISPNAQLTSWPTGCKRYRYRQPQTQLRLYPAQLTHQSQSS